MMFTDCIKCWGTPCTCGYEYRKMNKDARIKQAAAVLGVPQAGLAKLIAEFVPDKHPMDKEE